MHKATIERKKQGGYRCLGKQRDGSYALFVGGKMGNTPAIAREIASSVPSDNVPGYLAAVLRAYRQQASPDERLAGTIERIGLEEFRGAVEKSLDLPYDDLAAGAREAREAAERSQCIGPLGHR